MAIAKVILNGVTQMDVTQKTVDANKMLSGTTALKNDGTDITGSIESKTSSDLTVSGATVTAPAGHYVSAASKSVASGSASTPATTITANPTVSVNSSGLITATVSKTQNVTPTVSAGYVSSGTAGTVTVSGSGTSQLTTQAAQTIHPSTTDQTIASGKYLTGAQTIKAVTTTNLTAANIVQGVTVKVGDSTDDDCVASVTGTAETGGDDFIITLSKNASTGEWEPDCTYAEAQAAYDGGKNVAFEASLSGSPIPCGEDSRTSNKIKYFVFEPVVTSNDFVFNYNDYTWNSVGINAQNPYPYYDTNSATAVPADVASGKVFYNADGKQTGTASGGATNYVQGTFTTSSTGGVTQSISIPYSGNGYPISWTIEPTGGIYGNEDLYNLIQRYVTINYCGTKKNTNTSPVYSTGGVTGNQSGADVMYLYKNSTSNSLVVARTGGDITVYTGEETAYAGNMQVIFKNATTMCIYVASTSYGFAPNIEYTYRIVYSE